MSERIESVVIGAGQAGLATGYHLMQRRCEFVILDKGRRIGDSWRSRWDSLRLFTPAPYDGLPGMPFPAGRSTYPTKDEVGDFLEEYARRLELPVRSAVAAEKVNRNGGEYVVDTSAGQIRASNVVVAIGSYHQPYVPDFSSRLDPSIHQLHSLDYRNPDQFSPGPALVVGAGNSGAEIALELAAGRKVWLSGRDTGQEPTTAGSFPDRLLTPLLWFGATRFTVNTPMGRKIRDRFLDPPRGIPLGRVRRKDLVRAGVDRVGRTIGVQDGRPVVDGRGALDAASVIWCTGYRPDFSWIEVDLEMRDGWPIHDRGVVASQPGLYFMGLLFQHSLSSALLGGVGRDARFIADAIESRVLEPAH